MVVAQLVEWSLRTPDIHGSNTDTSKMFNRTVEKKKIKIKSAREWPIFKKGRSLVTKLGCFVDLLS